MRAFELADTGDFNHWEEIGGVMEADEHALATKRLSSDPMLRQMLNARCQQAKERQS